MASDACSGTTTSIFNSLPIKGAKPGIRAAFPVISGGGIGRQGKGRIIGLKGFGELAVDIKLIALFQVFSDRLAERREDEKQS